MHKYCDYYNYCGEAEAALRKLLSQVSKAFRSSEIRKAFLLWSMYYGKGFITQSDGK
jgi:hypothetical protein